MVAYALYVVYNMEQSTDIFSVLIALIKRVYLDLHGRYIVIEIIDNLFGVIYFVKMLNFLVYKVA